MKNINLLINNSPKIVQVERYFLSRQNSYLIYSEDGQDLDGNVKIYVAKIINNNRVAPIELQDEWDAVKKDIIGIVNANKEQSNLLIQDMDYRILNNLEITSSKALRLPNSVMPYLRANQPEFNVSTIDQNERALAQKTISLQEMNQELKSLMNQVERQFDTMQTAPEISNPEPKDPLEATMEVIMPTSAFNRTENEKEDIRKEKFSLKSLFGIKKEEENITNLKQGMSNKSVISRPEIKTRTTREAQNSIVSESDMPKPKTLEPITINDKAAIQEKTKSVENKVIEIPVAPVGEVENISQKPYYSAPVSRQTMVAEERLAQKQNEFEFFDAMTSEIPQRVNIADNGDGYKSRYENTIKENQELKEQVLDLEKKLNDYKHILGEIKNIVD